MRTMTPIRLLAAAAMAGSTLVTAVVFSNSDASAAAPVVVTCSYQLGAANANSGVGTVYVSGCNTAADTGGSGVASSTSLTSDVVIHWNNGKTSVESMPTRTTVTKPTCASKYAGLSLYNEVVSTSHILTGTAGGTETALRGGAVSATVCIYPSSTAGDYLVKSLNTSNKF